MLGVLRFEVAEDDEGFLAAAREALAVLAGRPGFRSGRLARAYDQPAVWCLVTEWESVGAYRRALGSFEVRSVATPLLSRALPEPSAYEPLVIAGGRESVVAGEPGGPGDVRTRESDRAGRGRVVADPRETAVAAGPTATTDHAGTDSIAACGRNSGTSGER